MLLIDELPAERALSQMIDFLVLELKNLIKFKIGEDEFIDGQRTAYVECLEAMTKWKKFDVYGPNESIEALFPLTRQNLSIYKELVIEERKR